MYLTINQVRRLKQAVTFLCIGTVGGLVYVIAEGQLHLRYAVVNALLIGFLLSAVLTVFELIWFRRQVRRMRFITLFVLRMAVYSIAIFCTIWLILVISRMRRFDLTYSGVMQSEEWQNYLSSGQFTGVVIYALLIMSTVNFTRQMSRKLGQGMLLAYITGRYTKPVRQERVIMFVDVINSRLIIEKLGAMGFHRFFNDLVYDITESIVLHSGIILHYVEDQIVVSWSMQKGLSNANCIRTFFAINHKLDDLKEEYYEKYGFVPAVRGAAHCGKLIRAELGIVKTEISSTGDVLNTTSRILGQCRELESNFLISEKLMEKVELPPIYEPRIHEGIQLKGKIEPVRLYTIETIKYAAV